MPTKGHVEGVASRSSYLLNWDFDMHVFLEMQIKKMKEMVPPLYAQQANDRNDSSTTSPKQPKSEKGKQPNGQEAQSLCYPGNEAEGGQVSAVTCVKCRSVHQIPTTDLKKQNKQSQSADQKFYVCNQCSLRVPPPFHFVSDTAGAIDEGNLEKGAPRKNENKFQVRNFQPGKYYCDKCRFSTKDPLQYKKHMIQHEEIQFICSHCNHISYTKGEFQRHLVQHTGTFPYQCEYCSYGAIRNDYIVKHTRRVHEVNHKRQLKPIGSPARKRASWPLGGKGMLRAQSGPKANKPLDPPSSAGLSLREGQVGAGDRADSREPAKETASAPERAGVLDSTGETLFEDRNVEVEVVSPVKEPVLPGMPLTVVAPAELVVPANCLAQLLDIKTVNGTQQLILKLIPLREKSPLKPARGPAPERPNLPSPQAFSEQEKSGPAAPTKPPSPSGRVREPAGGGDKKHEGSGSLGSSDPCPSGCSSANTQGRGEPCPGRDPGVALTREAISEPGRPDGFPVSLRPHDGGNGNSPPKLSNGIKAEKSTQRKAALPLVPSSASHQEEGKRAKDQPTRPANEGPSTAAGSHLGASPSGQGGAGSGTGNDFLFKIPPSHQQLNEKVAGEPLETLVPGQYSHLSKLALAPNGSTPVASDISQMLETPPGESSELEISAGHPNSPEGPVISSVFSLSTGEENVPEGIKWGDPTHKSKSATLLCEKIARLISASESAARPNFCLPTAKQQQQQSVSAEPPRSRLPEVHDVPGPGTDSPSPLEMQDGSGADEQFVHVAVGPPDNDGDGKFNFRGMKKAHIATPVFIPEGTVLRVLSCGEKAHEVESKSQESVNPYCKETLLPRPVPLSALEKPGPDFPSLPGDVESPDRPRNLRTFVRSKAVRAAAPHSPTSRQTPTLPHPPKGSNPNKSSRPAAKGSLTPRYKSKPGNQSKKKAKGQLLGERPPVVVARQLRLVPAKVGQLIKCPRRNQPVIVLNHPDVDSLEVINVMKIINKYKGNVLKVVLSERTSHQLGIRRNHRRLTYRNLEAASPVKKQIKLKMKLKKIHKNNYQVVDSLPEGSLQCMFKCWFCGRLYEDQEEWMSHGQRHLIEATRDWDMLSLPLEDPKG
ncbi:zinc finger protein 518B isoform X2 [Tachyglossus aculeatus]|nr:zinc finger protein 518B isoform X2 [Tachyglossus aculeatus]